MAIFDNRNGSANIDEWTIAHTSSVSARAIVPFYESLGGLVATEKGREMGWKDVRKLLDSAACNCSAYCLEMKKQTCASKFMEAIQKTDHPIMRLNGVAYADRGFFTDGRFAELCSRSG
jgi:hypothetical protein